MRNRILVDRHQADLLYSLQLLFEDRLGYDLYVPVGHEWWDANYWRFGQVFGDDRLAQQYLTIDAHYRRPVEDECRYHLDNCFKCGAPWTGCSCGHDCGFCEDCACDPAEADHYVTFDRHHPERQIRAITLDECREAAEEWAFVMATVQENEAGFQRLAGELGARYLLQVGNTGQQIDWNLDPLALVSSEMPIAGRGVRCHQEFDSTDVFGYRDPEFADRRRIASFVNCMPRTTCGIHPVCGWQTLEEYRALLPSHRYLVHGIDGPAGNLADVRDIASAMTASGWGWHDKPQGDGFGHVIHNWAAIGRPLIGRASHYVGRLAEPFWEDLVTCIDLDRRTPTENAVLIREISDDRETHKRMCKAIRRRFDEVIDFDREEQDIRRLLGI